MCIHTPYSVTKLVVSRVPLILIFPSEGQPWVGSPKKIGSDQTFFPVHIFGGPRKIQKWNFEIPLGELHASEYVT